MNVKLRRLSTNNKLEVDIQIDKFIRQLNESNIQYDERKVKVELLLLHKAFITAMKDMKALHTSDIDYELYEFIKVHSRELSNLLGLEVEALFISYSGCYVDVGSYRVTGEYWI